MSADDKKNSTDDAGKNEAVELNDDDLDAVAGGAGWPSCKHAKSFTEKGGCKISKEFAHSCNQKYCSHPKSDDIAFIKGENVVKKG